MRSKTSRDMRLARLRTGLSMVLLAAAMGGVSGLTPATASTPDKSGSLVAQKTRGPSAVPRRQSRGGTLPHSPEYGFMKHLPPNAIRMPGYIFVPGVGILGESCDLPTSACSNRYRDIQ
jgi:hypothetical protein